MSTAFVSSLVGLALLGAAAFALLTRGTEPLLPALPALGSWVQKAGIRLARLWRHARLIGSVAWSTRYQRPWVMILGEREAGKSAWLASARQLRLAQDGQGPPAPGPVPKTEVLALRQGVLFDPQGDVWANATDRAAVLGALSDERPERALDALLLVVSAASLRDRSDDERRQLGIEASQQLELVRASLGLLLPVYVVVNQSDRLDGFTAFWTAVATKDAAQQQMVGWSAPGGLEADELHGLVDQALDAIDQELTELQVDAARRAEQIAQPQEFFLFPHRLGALREPLRDYLACAFREQAWQRGFACRGVYFCGVLSPAAAPPSPREDQAFVDDLLVHKLLAESGLARISRPALWSRDWLVRSLQIAMVGGAAVLALGVGWSSLQLSQRVEQMVTGAQALPESSPGPLQGACLNAPAVSAALQQVNALDRGTRTVWMPASLVAPAPDDALLRRVNERLLTPTVLPALACQLRQRLTQLDSAPTARSEAAQRQALLSRAERAATLDRQLADYQRLIGSAHDASAQRDALNRLLQGLLGLPPQGRGRSDLLGRALAAEPGPATATLAQAVPETLPASVVQSLAALPEALRQALQDELRSGPARVAWLEAPPPLSGKASAKAEAASRDGLRAAAQGLTQWLAWVDSHWLPFSAERNPCSLAAAELGGRFESLRLSAADRSLLGAALQRLSQPERCFNPLRKLIEAMKLGGTRTPLLSDASGPKARLHPQWQAELQGLRALLEQAFMQMDGEMDLACRAGATGWSAPAVDTALRYARDYLSLSAGQGLPPLGSSDAQRPLFDQLARNQLERAMNGALHAAQFTTQPLPPSAPQPVDDNLPKISADFGQTLKSLLPVQQLYAQLRLNASAANLTQCSRSFALTQLQRITDLATASQLYAPGPGSGGALVNIGPTPVARDYLAQQLARAATLVAYSQPFVTLLSNSQAVNDGSASGANDWANSARELQRYADQKDTSGSVGQLEGLFLNNFATLTSDNCAARLSTATAAPGTPASAASGATAMGSDLFARSASLLSTQVRLSCTANAYANYLVLAQRFNTQLAGRYPFADLNKPDLPLADAKRFFLDYAAQAQPLEASLTASTDARATAALAFLKQLDATATFLRSSLSAGELSQALTLTPSFRAQLKSSVGAENLLSWALSSGPRVIEFPGRPGTSLSWPFGQALSLDLTWPDGSVGGGADAVWRPSAAGAPGSYQLRGGTASFSFGGDWALLRMIEGQRPSAGPTVDPLDPTRLLLEFKVLTQRTAAGATQPSAAEAQVYLGLNLSAPDPKTTAATPVVWPGRFPRSAPTQ